MSHNSPRTDAPPQKSDAVNVSGSSAQYTIDMHLTVHPARLTVGTISKQKLPSLTHNFLSLFFFPSNEDHFFSFTETEDEISLIIDCAAAKKLPAGAVTFAPSVWRAIELGEGELGFNAVQEIVTLLSEPLAKAGIPIFYLSTNDCDYTLVEENKLKDALSVLTNRFQVVAEGFELTPRVPGDCAMSPPFSSQLALATENNNSSAAKSDIPQELVRNIAVGNDKLYLVKLNREELSNIPLSLLKLLFFPDITKKRFFSWSETGKEISIIIDSTSLSSLNSSLFGAGTDPWILMKVDAGPLGFASTGIVSSIATALASGQLSIFYLSTFLTDYVLVRERDVGEATHALESEWKITRRTDSEPQ